MKALFFTLIFLTLSPSAFAGGLQCQVGATCQCQADGTCDENGYPITPSTKLVGLDPCMTECLNSATPYNTCLKACLSKLGLTLTSSETPTIQCGEGDQPLRVILGKPFEAMPDEGKVPALFENAGLPLHDYVTTSINPIFHFRQIEFLTAFCSYKIKVDSSGAGKHYVFDAHSECEGARSEIRCELL